jgi:hypothetical protein
MVPATVELVIPGYSVALLFLFIIYILLNFDPTIYLVHAKISISL